MDHLYVMEAHLEISFGFFFFSPEKEKPSVPFPQNSLSFANMLKISLYLFEWLAVLKLPQL